MDETPSKLKEVQHAQKKKTRKALTFEENGDMVFHDQKEQEILRLTHDKKMFYWGQEIVDQKQSRILCDGMREFLVVIFGEKILEIKKGKDDTASET